MALITNIKFSRDNNNYEVSIDLEDQKSIENLITFDIIAKVTDNNGVSYSENLCVEIDFNGQFGRVLHGDRELYRFSFSNIGVRMDPQTGEEIIPGIDGNGELEDHVYDHIKEGMGETIEEIINAMPVPDPVFGCLIKAGISSIVGQVLTCNELRNNYGKEGGKIRQVLRCLKKHISGIALRTIFRATRCMLRLGF